jgi:hypothetical protein
MQRWSWTVLIGIVASVAIGCGDGQEDARRVEGTSGRGVEASTVLSGCVERNTDTGNFVLVVDGNAAQSVQESDRLVLEKASDELELNQIIGRRVTLEGTLGNVDAIADAGTEAPVAGEGADPSQTQEANVRGMRVTAVRDVGETCALEDR